MPMDPGSSLPSRRDLEIVLAILKDGPRRCSISALDVRRQLPAMSLARAEALLVRLTAAGLLDWNPRLKALTVPEDAAARIAHQIDARFDKAPADWAVADLMRRIRRFNAHGAAVVRVSRLRLLGPALAGAEADETLTIALGFEDLPIGADRLAAEIGKLSPMTRRSPRFRAAPRKIVRATARRGLLTALARAHPRLSLITEDQIGAAGLAYHASLAAQPAPSVAVAAPHPVGPQPARPDAGLHDFYAGDTFHFQSSRR